MNTKKCSKCGWVYPGKWPGKTCKFCRTPLPEGYCSYCNTWSTDLRGGVCQACETDMVRAWRHGKAYKADDRFLSWLALIKKADKKPLTEQEWSDACKHFKGCAYCGSLEISARSMFIPFQKGGRYCSWNIIPSCEICETSVRLEHNPFIRMDKTNQAIRLGHTAEKLENIVEYLEVKINERANEGF